MKKTILGILPIWILATVTTMAADLYGASAATSDKSFSIKEALTYAIQDEYIARAEYETILDKFGIVRPFSNIIEAEETHISLLTEVFKNDKLQIPQDRGKEYTVVPSSLQEALQAGIKAEKDNIAMYDSFMKHPLPANVRDVFIRLRNASEKHLQAFTGNLGNNRRRSANQSIRSNSKAGRMTQRAGRRGW